MEQSPNGGFAVTGTDCIFRGYLIDLERIHFRGPDGVTFTREVVRHPGAVAVVPIHEDGTVTLVRQMRAPFNATVLEVVAGTCDVDGEDRRSAALRELEEEAGLRATELVELVTIYNSPGYCDQATTIYAATGLSAVPTQPSGPEELAMTSEVVSLHAIESLVATGALHDATTICALMLGRSYFHARG